MLENKMPRICTPYDVLDAMKTVGVRPLPADIGTPIRLKQSNERAVHRRLMKPLGYKDRSNSVSSGACISKSGQGFTLRPRRTVRRHNMPKSPLPGRHNVSPEVSGRRGRQRVFQKQLRSDRRSKHHTQSTLIGKPATDFQYNTW